MTDTLTPVSDLVDHVAQEMHAEAFCIGMVNSSWRNLPSDTQDGWRMIATAAIEAMKVKKRGKL